MSKAFVSKEARDLMSVALAFDPTMLPMVRHLFRWGAQRIRPDYMLVKGANGTCPYERLPDPAAWNFDLPHLGMHACLIRHRDGQWSIHS